MILNKIRLGGFGGSLLSDNVMNLRKIAITAAVVLTGDGKLYWKARSLLNCTDTESELKLVQWNPSKPDTLGPNSSVHYSEVSLTKGLCMFLSQMVNTTVLKLYCTVIHNMASLNLLLSKSEIFIKCSLSS